MISFHTQIIPNNVYRETRKSWGMIPSSCELVWLVPTLLSLLWWFEIRVCFQITSPSNISPHLLMSRSATENKEEGELDLPLISTDEGDEKKTPTSFPFPFSVPVYNTFRVGFWHWIWSCWTASLETISLGENLESKSVP